MKKLFLFLLCVISMVSLAACGNAAGDASPDTSSDISPEVQIPSPFTDCGTLDEAAAISGFRMSAPETANGYSERSIQAVKDEMIQVFYRSGEEEICIRKATGDGDIGRERGGDISGDYTEYAQTGKLSVDDLEATVKGDRDKIHVAFWTDHDYSYSITSTAALDPAVVSDLIRAMCGAMCGENTADAASEPSA